MEAVLGIVRGGRVEFETPNPIPEGTRVRVEPAAHELDDWGAENEWPETPEGIEAMIAELRAIEPAVLTPDEQADLQAFRRRAVNGEPGQGADAELRRTGPWNL
jgi:hypothetical protein